MNDWNLFWGATTAAATIATAVSTWAVLWVERRRRAEPRWIIVDLSSVGAEEPSSFPGVPFRAGRIANLGDGEAYDVRLTGRRCAVRLWGDRGHAEPFVSVVRPGESIPFRAWARHEFREEAGVRVQWTPPPTRISKPIVEVIPLMENFTTLDGQLLGDWRYRELPWWRLLQRWRQHSARRARRRARLALAAARAHEDEWAKPPGSQKS